MLIRALSDYYDILAADGKVLPDGYSRVKIHYLVALTPDGKIDEIIDYQRTEEVVFGTGKPKQKKLPRELVMPRRTEKPGIDANIAEHRPLYLFGLNYDKKTDALTPDDEHQKAWKSHEAFVKSSREFLKDIQSPIVDAFRNFVTNWNPEMEIENRWLKGLGKDYGKSGFAFCQSGAPDKLLHEDPLFVARWEMEYEKKNSNDKNIHISQCAVSGEIEPIARIHGKIRGINGGLPTGTVLVGFNNASEESYGNEQSYNSNVSEKIMKKYTEALNYLLSDSRHKVLLDDMTIVFWAMNREETCEDLFMKMFFNSSDKMDAAQTEDMLKSLWKDSKHGTIRPERLQSLDNIQTDVDFYMVGMKANSSRISLKFIIRKKYGDILWNVARFQNELQTGKNFHQISLFKIKSELISPKSRNEKVNPALATKLFESVIYGNPYPASLLETMVRRVKTDENGINAVRAGVIKACINRNSAKELPV